MRLHEHASLPLERIKECLVINAHGAEYKIKDFVLDLKTMKIKVALSDDYGEYILIAYDDLDDWTLIFADI